MSVLETIIFVLYSGSLLFIFLYSLSQLHLTWLYSRKKSKKEASTLPAKSENWPAVTVQLPIYNERYVVERLLEAIIALDYPPEKLQIQVLDDSTDETRQLLIDKIAFYRNQGTNIEYITRPNRQGFKAGALQHGLTQATGEFIAIFDADFVPDPSFLKETLPQFSKPKIGVVQTRWGHINQYYSLLTRLQAFGLNAHFTIEQSGRATGAHFINFNGTAGVWRKACILDAGGWQADTLTEDLDLSYRAQLRNWQFKYLESTISPAELPAAMPAVKSQQFRWMKGAAENVRKNLGRVLTSDKPFGTKFHAFFHLLNSSVFIFILLSALLSIPVLYLKQDSSITVPYLNASYLFLISGLGLITFYWISFRQTNPAGSRSIFYFLPQFILFLSVSMGLSLHNTVAVLEGYAGVKTPFIRTPKFNILTRSDSWVNSAYATKSISFLVFLEGILSLYFGFGLYLAWQFQDFGMVAFHTMLCFGFGAVFYYSVKHSR